MEYIVQLKEITILVSVLRIYFISLCTNYLSAKIINNKKQSVSRKIIICIMTLIIAIAYASIRKSNSFFISNYVCNEYKK